MAMRIQNNIAALNAQNSLQTSQTAMEKSLARLSSGYRINSAKDDAAGLAISQGFRANIASVKVAQRNITEGNALLQVADGALSNVGDILIRMKELATQAASDNAGTNVAEIAAEFDELALEITRIDTSTQYAGTALTGATFAFQVGYTEVTADSQISVDIGDIGSAVTAVTFADATEALDTMAALDDDILANSQARAAIGAAQNRLGYAGSNLAATLENFTAAESVIRDVDMAAEMTSFTKNQILVQAGTAMLAQANTAPQQILSLLKG